MEEKKKKYEKKEPTDYFLILKDEKVVQKFRDQNFHIIEEEAIKKVSLKEVLTKHEEWLEEYEKDNTISESDVRRFNANNFKDSDEYNIKFMFVTLRKVRLKKANLGKVYFYGCDLYKVDLSEANLFKANFSNSMLEDANLINTNLTKASVKNCNLVGANLVEANLTDAEFIENVNVSGAKLTGAKINRHTLENFKVKNGGIGINGIYTNHRNDEKKNISPEKLFGSAAFLPFNPNADSKQGRDVNVVIDNLKHCQHLTGVYWTMTGICLINLLLKLGLYSSDSLKTVPFIGVVEMKVPFLFILSFIFIPVVLLMIHQGLEKAYEGSKYLQTRDEISKVGNFAWTLTQYTPKSVSEWSWGIYKSVRWLMVFCAPVVLMGLWLSELASAGFSFKWEFVGYWIVITTLLTICDYLLDLVEKFQKPLIFDPYKEFLEAEKKKEEEAPPKSPASK